MGFQKALQIEPQLEILLPDHKHTFPKSSLRAKNILLESDIWRSETLNMGLSLVNGTLSHAWRMCFNSLSESPFSRPFLLNKRLLIIFYDKVNSNYRVILLQTSINLFLLLKLMAEIPLKSVKQAVNTEVVGSTSVLFGFFTMVPYTMGHSEMQPCAKSLW